jgi:hypothetical protein
MWTWMWMLFEAVWVCCSCRDSEGAPHDLGQCSHLHMGSLRFNNIGAAGARALGAALQVNRTLTELE